MEKLRIEIRREKLLSLMDSDSLTKQDFINSFEKVLDFVVRNEKQMQGAITRFEQTYTILVNKINNDHSSRYEELKGQTNQLFVG